MFTETYWSVDEVTFKLYWRVLYSDFEKVSKNFQIKQKLFAFLNKKKQLSNSNNSIIFGTGILLADRLYNIISPDDGQSQAFWSTTGLSKNQ